ncbi:MAG: T9SS type A sorting domain-containing protein [Flavobacteriaceae bacterium]|nr:T9SS type A sorting domain-containing protein [Flavobacteriaceae bacterium]
MIPIVVNSVDDQKGGFNITVFPNPGKDQVNLSIENATGRIQFKIVDAQGKLIFVDEIISDYVLNVQDWPAGIYCYMLIEMDSGAFVSGKLRVVK